MTSTSSGTVLFGPMRLHTADTPPARTAKTTAALVWKIPRLAAELLPYVNQAAARITMDHGRADTAWLTLVDELSALDPASPPAVATDLAQTFGTTIFELLHSSASKSLPIAGRLDAAMETERHRYLATLANHAEPPEPTPLSKRGRRPSPPITIDREIKTSRNGPPTPAARSPKRLSEHASTTAGPQQTP